MTGLPTGTVTFLYTDIEGSTRLAELRPEAMPAALVRHDAILHEAVTAHDGFVFRKIGDEFNVAFATPLDALGAALAAQRGLKQHPWGATGPLRVRMALHTGPASPREGDYEGYLTLSHTKRLMSVAYGGQILLSQTTEALLRDQLPAEVTLRDLGEHRLKDFDRAEHVFQVVAPDLPADFPPLPTLTTIANNLPIQLTSFVGREQELAEVKELLSSTRLLTLTGPGGTGKTRLSLQVAAETAEEFSNGVWVVELASLTDPSLLVQTVAVSLGVREQTGRTVLDALLDHLRAKILLLIFDNCEHLIDACAQLANTLLRAAPGVKILASSREALGVAGETAYRVPSLTLPPAFADFGDLGVLARNDCVHLFLDRATAMSSTFRLTQKNAPSIVDICRRLDGIPLAIELAAARVTVFSPEEIASHLDDRFRLLTGGSRTALERHQTLRALIDWSYDLLSEEERRLFRHLSVFSGGWTFEAAEAVCSELAILDLLTQLVKKSLVMVDADAGADGTRYRLPETIRQYARDKLFESGEAEQVRDRHLASFTRFAERAEPQIRSADQLAWLDRVETEHDNARTALAWSLESNKSESALRLAGALCQFWSVRGYLSEGEKWVSEALELDRREQGRRKELGGAEYTPSLTELARRAKALYAAGFLRTWAIMDLDTSRTLLEGSLNLWREIGDKWWMALVLNDLGLVTHFGGDSLKARAQLEEAVALARQAEDKWVLAVALSDLGRVLADIDVRAAQPIGEEAVALARVAGDKKVLNTSLLNLAGTYYYLGNLQAMAPVVEEAMDAARAIQSTIGIGWSIFTLAVLSLAQGDQTKAMACSKELLTLSRETGLVLHLGNALLCLGCLACVSDQPQVGVQILSMLEALARRLLGGNPATGLGGSGVSNYVYSQYLDKARSSMEPKAFERAWAEGQGMAMEEAIALALEVKT